MAIRAQQLRMTLADALETAREAAELSQDDLWFAYKQAGGAIGLAAFKNYLRGLSNPQWHEYDIIAQVLNEALGEERLPRIPFQRSPAGDGGAPKTSDLNSHPGDGAMGGSLSPAARLAIVGKAA